jgi:tetratricopeptide (TPR) repeat protein
MDLNPRASVFIRAHLWLKLNLTRPFFVGSGGGHGFNGFTPTMNSRCLLHLGLLWALLAFVSACSTPPPTTAAGFKAAAQAKSDKGDYDGAIADYTKAIAMGATDPATYYGRGRARESNNDFDGAIADYNKVIELDPNNGEAYNDRGFAKESKGDLEGAAVDLNKAAQLKSQ